MTPRITGLVNTLNASATLAQCLESMQPHVDELLIVDMESSDETVAIAQSFGARVLSHEPVGYVEPARAFGIQAATHEWILLLDADEVITPSLGLRLRSIAQGDEADVVIFSRRNFMFGDVPEQGPLSPRLDRHRRFFKRNALVHSPEIHVPPEPVVHAREVVLPPTPDFSVLHFAYVDLSEWLARSDRYTSIEAQAQIDRGKAPSTASLLLDGLRVFLREYIKRRGFRDGWRGVHISLLLAQYRVIAGLKAQQLERAGTADEVRQRYRELARRILQSD